MKRVLTIIGILLVCLAGGYACGCAIESIMETVKKRNAEIEGYIGRPGAKFADTALTPEILHTLGYLSDPQLSPDGKYILYGVSYSSIEKNRSCRNLYLCKADGSDSQRLTTYASSISNARWSTDGSHVWFIQNGQIWRAAFRVSAKGTAKLGKREKMSEVKAGVGEFALAADESFIIYTSTIPGPVSTPEREFPDLDKANAYSTEGLMYRHWDHWVTETPRTFVSAPGNGIISELTSFDILGDEPYELPTEPFGGLEQLSINPNGRYIAYSCRKKSGAAYAFSTDTDIYIYDIVTGATNQVTFGGGYDTDPVWSPDGEHLAWISMERDGYEADQQRLMVADALPRPECTDGQYGDFPLSAARRLAAGLDADASGIFWAPDSRQIIFNATEKGIQGLYRADAKTGEWTRLTRESWLFNFGQAFALTEDKVGEYRILCTYESMMFPTEIAAVICMPNGNNGYEQLSFTNRKELSRLGNVRQESIWLDTPQGEKLQCWVLYPSHFVEGRKFPVIEMFNGGPQSCLDQSWSKRWNFRLMAEQGYVVLLPNRHGCSGFGQAWKEQISGDYQGLNMQDYMLAAKWAKSQSWCGKIAGVGASYGGFSVYNMAGIHNGLYDCFIAHAGIFDVNAMWYTTEESWFTNWDNGGLGKGESWGGIQQGGAPYSSLPAALRQYAQSPDKKVTKWDTPILCIHGMLDFRIPYEQGMAAFNAAQMMGVPSKLIVFPEENHWITAPQNAIYWQREFFDWLEKWCKSEE
ncbi:MAG: S9 family peptidase [Bacteroidales bacterium]|nr:S9 family peptidase [Candidatus Cryptobacteroides aphodequi]